MDQDVKTLGEALGVVDGLPWRMAFFLGGPPPWDEQTPCSILDPDDSDDPDEDPEQAKVRGQEYAMGVQQAQDVISNVKAQKVGADMATLLRAFNFYHTHDAFIRL